MTVKYWNGTSYVVPKLKMWDGTQWANVGSAGTATADKVLSGYTFSNDTDVDISGTMPNRGSINVTPSTSNKNFSSGYYSGITVYGDANLVASNIKRGVTIFGVAGSLTPFEGAGQIMWKACSGISFVKGYQRYGAVNPIFCYQSSMLYIQNYEWYFDDENAIVTNNPVDLTNVSKIRADVVSSLGINPDLCEQYMIVSTSKTGRYTVYNARISVKTNIRQWFEMDVSSLSGSYYLRFHVYNNSYDFPTTLSIYEIQFMY